MVVEIPLDGFADACLEAFGRLPTEFMVDFCGVDRVHLSGRVTIAGAGPIEIGDHVNISHGSTLLSSSDDFAAAAMAGPLVPDEFRRVDTSPIVVGRHAIVGAGAVLLPGATVGEGATIGALSLVKQAIPPGR